MLKKGIFQDQNQSRTKAPSDGYDLLTKFHVKDLDKVVK